MISAICIPGRIKIDGIHYEIESPVYTEFDRSRESDEFLIVIWNIEPYDHYDG
jgi:hypothetical protein